MATERSRLPIARQEQLIVEDVLDETIIYDLRRNRAHSLNRTAALVWRHCDGRTGVRTLARLLAKELEVPPSEAMVWMALNRLAKARLLDVSGAVHPGAGHRRTGTPPPSAAIRRLTISTRSACSAPLCSTNRR